MKKKKPITLSFEVVEYRTYRAEFTTVEVRDAILRSYTYPNERIAIRGGTWPIGTKVDFVEVPCQLKQRHP